MKPAAIGLLAGWLGLVLGQAAPTTEAFPWLGSGVSVSALGVLSWSVWYLLAKYIPSRDAAHAKERQAEREAFTIALADICKRHERWEIQRHQDAERLDTTLRELMSTCAATQAHQRRIIEGGPPPAIDAEGV